MDGQDELYMATVYYYAFGERAIVSTSGSIEIGARATGMEFRTDGVAGNGRYFPMCWLL